MKTVTLLTLCVVLVSLLSAETGWSAKLYKWVDNEGNISYQDSPPPEGSKLIKEEDIELSTTSSTPSQAQPTQSVTVYTVNDCEPCELMMLRLQNWGVNAQEQSLQNREVQARILQTSDSLSAPTLFIGDEIISDLTSANLISKLQEAGYQINSPDTNQIDESEQ